MDVSFEEENRYAVHNSTPAQAKGGLTGLVMRMGIAKDAAGAQYVLVITLILCLAVAGFVWFFTGGSGASIPEDEYEQRAQNVNRPPQR